MEKVLSIFFIVCIMFFSSSVFSKIESNPLRIPLHAAKITLDPSGVQDVSSLFVSRQVNCQLVRSYGSTVSLEAAKSVHFETPTKILITIKEQAVFQDGSTVTSDDVVASLEHLRKSRHVLRNVFTWVKEIDVLSPKEIAIILKKPVPQFLNVFSSPNYAIFKKSFLLKAEKNSALWQIPMGCGNYKVVEHSKNAIRLEPLNEGRPIEFFLNQSDQFPADEIDRYDISDLHFIGGSKQIEKFYAIEIFDPTQIYLGLNTKSKHWKNKNERCNFISKLNSQNIIDIYGESAKSATDILPEGILGYMSSKKKLNEIYQKYRADNYNQINNFCLSYLTVSIPEHYRSAYLKMIQKIYPDTFTTNITDNKHFGKTFVESGCDAIVLGLKSNTLDAYDILAVFSEIDPNFTGFSDIQISKEIEDSQNESDPKVRMSIYRKIVDQLEDSCLIYPILTIPMKTVYIKKELTAPNIGKGPLNEYYLGEVK